MHHPPIREDDHRQQGQAMCERDAELDARGLQTIPKPPGARAVSFKPLLQPFLLDDPDRLPKPEREADRRAA